jgi:anti-sigma factor RsiW
MKENLSCEACERELLALIDGALTPSVARVVSEHAASCASCGSALEDYRRQSLRLRRMPLLPAPAFLEDRVMRKVLGARGILTTGWQRLGAAAGAASFALTVALLVNLTRVAKALGISDPSVVLVSTVNHALSSLAAGTKWLGQEVTLYVPLAKQLWLATLTLRTVPRTALVLLRTPEVQVAGALLLTVGLALYLLLRSRHERSVGHVCLSL